MTLTKAEKVHLHVKMNFLEAPFIYRTFKLKAKVLSLKKQLKQQNMKYLRPFCPIYNSVAKK